MSNRETAEPVVVTMSILAAAQFLFAGAGLADVIGDQAVFLGMLVVGAIQVGIQFWVRGQTVAVANVAAFVDPAGKTVAGPAAIQDDGDRVEVIQAL